MRAPRPEGELVPPELLSVDLGEGEEVRWIWTHSADGESVVTGYAIVEKDSDGVHRGPTWRVLCRWHGVGSEGD